MLSQPALRRFTLQWRLLFIVVLTASTRPVTAQGIPSIKYLLGGDSNGVYNIAMSPDGNYYASTSSDGTAKLWSTANNTLVRTFTDGAAIGGVGFTPDSSTLITGDTNGWIIEWNVADASTRLKFSANFPALALTVSADGNYIATASTNPWNPGSNEIRVFLTATGKQVCNLQGHTSTVYTLAFSPANSNILASGSNDGTAVIWNLKTQKETYSFNYGGGPVYTVAISPDGTTLAVAGPSQPVKLYSLGNGTLTSTVSLNGDSNYNAVAFSPDGSTLAVGSSTNNITLWNIAAGAPISSFPWSGGQLVYFNDGNSLAQVNGNRVLRYQAPNGTLIGNTESLGSPDGLPNGITCVAFTPNGQTIGVLGSNYNWFQTGWLSTFATATGARIAGANANGGFTFSPDGTTVCTTNIIEYSMPELGFLHQTQYWAYSLGFSTDGSEIVSFNPTSENRYADTAEITRTSDATQIGAFQAATNSACGSVVPDGTAIAVGYNNSINIYRASDGVLLNTLTVPNANIGTIEYLTWSNDHQYLVSAGNDDNIRLWVNPEGSSPTLAYTLPYNNGMVLSIAISPYDDTFTVGRSDLSVTEYNLMTGAVDGWWGEETGTGVISIAYSPDALAQAWGRADSTVVVVDNPFANALASVTVNPSVVQAAQSALGTVTLNAPAPTGITVSLSSSNPAVTVPQHVAIPAGQQSMTFTVKTSAVSTDTTVAIGASDSGLTRSANLTVQPAIALKAIAVAPTIVTGGQDAIGVVTLSAAAPTGGLYVPLTNNSPNLVTIPAGITVAAGSHSAQFLVTTTAVASKQKVTLGATSGGVTKTTVLTVAPATVAAVTLIPYTVSSGENAFGLVTLSASATTDVTLTITSGSPSIAQTDATLVIPAGSMQGTFNITTTQGSVTKSTPVKITVTAYGASKTATLTVTP